METRTSMQDTFLNEARKSRVPVTIFMTNGFQQRGVVMSYDGYTVLVVNEGIQHLIYKAAISTIVPQRTVNYHPNREEGNGSEENE